MLVNIKTFLLDALVHTQAMQLLDAVEQGKSTGGSPEVDNEDTKALGSEKSPSVTVEGTTTCREQTRHQRAENTADTMH